MSVAVSMNTLSIEELLNIVRPRHYFAVWREGGRVEYAAVDADEALMALPGMSIRVVGVETRPLNVQPPQDIMNHPRVRQLAALVGKQPMLRMFQYVFTPLKLRLLQRLETGAEFYMPTQKQDAPPIVAHVASACYVAYRSNSGRLHSETPGGARAYQLVAHNKLQPPQIYLMRLDKHRYEIGVRIPIDEEQVRQLTTYLFG